MSIAAMACARLGSKRVKAKNLRLLCGKPLIYYSIMAMKNCPSFDAVFVNSESDLIGQVAKRYGVEFYKRPAHLATSEARYDQYVADFMYAHPEFEVVVVVNPTSPFITSKELEGAVNYFFDNKLDSMYACEHIKTHCVFCGLPINFNVSELHPRSQDLIPVQALNFAVSMWRREVFLESYEKNGYGVYSGKMGVYPVEGLATIDIDWEEDFALAEFIMKAKAAGEDFTPGYDEVLDEIIAEGKEIQS